MTVEAKPSQTVAPDLRTTGSCAPTATVFQKDDFG